MKEGADPRNTVTLTSVNGTTEPGVEVLGTGSTAAEALKTSGLVGAAVQHNLFALQSVEGTNPYYMFTAIQVATSGPPQVKLSSTLRSVLAVLGVGAVLLFLVVSLGDAVDKKRAERRSQEMRAMVDETPSAGNLNRRQCGSRRLFTIIRRSRLMFPIMQMETIPRWWRHRGE